MFRDMKNVNKVNFSWWDTDFRSDWKTMHINNTNKLIIIKSAHAYIQPRTLKKRQMNEIECFFLNLMCFFSFLFCFIVFLQFVWLNSSQFFFSLLFSLWLNKGTSCIVKEYCVYFFMVRNYFSIECSILYTGDHD